MAGSLGGKAALSSSPVAFHILSPVTLLYHAPPVTAEVTVVPS